MAHDFQHDIDAIARIDAIPTILDVVCRTTGMGFAAVARVTEDRWIVCSVLDNIDFGLSPGGELKVETTICNEIRASHEAVVIDSVADDAVFCGHHTPAQYGFQSYISMPIIRKDGQFFGTLCAIDPRPARLKNPEIIGMFKLFAELIATHLDAAERLDAARAETLYERGNKELREQFIAVLGHDLRNPLGSIASGVNMLKRTDDEAKRAQILALMEGSVVRMSGLIDNVLDFARARMGAGLFVKEAEPKPVEALLDQVVSEFRSIHPDQIIETEFDAAKPVAADHLRLGRLFSNLIGNALTHGAAGEPVKAGASTAGGELVFWVANSGKPIAAEMMGNLFQPFVRGKTTNEQGLGLGLYIASEIAKMHGGKVEATSTPHETRFVFRMPLTRS
ncbi:GAF domain-containing sensor histidine kinase [Mesorhizobium sp. B2-3-4]|uniref:GAF domain-containing sensor histidine kinase n=1 Tax=Mesorhizobium sp. B2-3-4 TaxID=2589959 RepID=UPI00112B4277|nr:GAF domain-containing sensor histidine kinase [Mesorhizobium sp. B2-3-4]TPM39536.1 GAF domain-containing sensor histidine kinase [Mesorhizobium sp. B2-3-4]